MSDKFKKHLELSKQGFEALARVITYSCSHCGLCASLCPKQSIEMKDTIPVLVGECNRCGFCYQGCPRSFFPLTKIKQRWFGEENTEFERKVGRCVDRFTSRALVDETFEQGATGGTTTALLQYLLENKIVDAVLHLESIHKDCHICHHAKTRVSTTPEDALKGAKSKNQLTPILHDLGRVSDYDHFAVVGLSCHVEGLRKLQTIREDPELRTLFKGVAQLADKLIGNLKFIIAINCFSSSKYGAIDNIYQSLHVKEADVIKYAEDTKKSLYQMLHEGKNFLWFVQDNIVTKDGTIHRFQYTDYLDSTMSMGCMVCPSFIVCKEADVSIGVTASEIRLNEFGYNSVFLRNAELGRVFDAMVREKKLLKRPMWENKGTLLRKFVDRIMPSKDLINFRGYVETGTWKPSDDLYKRSRSVQSGKIMGLQRLYLAQTVKRNMMQTPAIKALKDAGKHVPDVI